MFILHNKANRFSVVFLDDRLTELNYLLNYFYLTESNRIIRI